MVGLTWQCLQGHIAKTYFLFSFGNKQMVNSKTSLRFSYSALFGLLINLQASK